jgi:flagella basal body P-ring formation protein FlgA
MLDIEPDNSTRATLRRMLVLLLAAVVMAFGIAARADSVRLYDQVGVQGPTVILSQVAQLQGPSAQQHSDVVIATLDQERTEFTVTLDDVEKALDDAGVNWGRVSLRGFNACRVTRLTQPPIATPDQGQAVAANIETPIGLQTPLTLRGVVDQYINDLAASSLGDIRIDFTKSDARELDIPILGRSIEIVPVSKNTLGKVPLVIRLYDAKRVAETINVSPKVQRVLLAVVADGPIARGEVFTRSRLKVRECIIDDDTTPITDPSSIIGQESSVSLRAGEMISLRKVKSPIMVKRGEMVDVRCFVGGLIVRTVGYATENGSIDDLIRLRSDSTGEDYYAIVTGRHQAAVSSPVTPRDQTAAAPADNTDQGATP